MGHYKTFYQLEQLKAEFSKLSIPDSNLKILFLSFSDMETRAKVIKTQGVTWEKCWDAIANQFYNYQKKNSGYHPVWFKIDWVTEVKVHKYHEIIHYLSSTKKNYFREGISFDEQFKLSFLEQEINGNQFITSINNEAQMVFSFNRINQYIKENSHINLKLSASILKNIWTFTTKSLFHDGNSVIHLESNNYHQGLRVIPPLETNIDLLKVFILKSSTYLASMVKPSGQFTYGYFPCFDDEIPTYNNLRHASSLYSLIEAYEFTPSELLRLSIERSMNYLINEAIKEVTLDNEKLSVVVEPELEYEIKLGGIAAALLAVTKYTNVFKDDSLLLVANQLASAILNFQNKDGSFIHVKHYPGLDIKDAFRIIYYEGEALLSLLRLYEIDQNKKWLDASIKSFQYFRLNNYQKHHDHWLSYASYELFKHTKSISALEFNLENADGILDFALNRETTYPTLLELLMATKNIINTAKKDNIVSNKFDTLSVSKLDKAIVYRLNHQISGYMFPEFAMYFKAPSKIVNSYFIRHHSFRIRIDDIEHNLSGYCAYYKLMKYSLV